jgi:predicted CopG family antitoxin
MGSSRIRRRQDNIVIVGLPDAGVKESRDRVMTALISSRSGSRTARGSDATRAFSLLTGSSECAHIARMSRNVNLDDEAIAALEAHRRDNESFSRVVKRLAPPPIKTFGDLEKFLDQLEGPLFSDLETLKRLRKRRPEGQNAH